MLRRKRISLNPKVPGGLIAHTEKGDYLVKGGKRFRFVSDRARDSWRLKIVNTNELALLDIKLSGVVGFRDGTLIRDISNNKIYLISDYKKMQIVSPDTLRELGFKTKDIVMVSMKEASIHRDGGQLNV